MCVTIQTCRRKAKNTLYTNAIATKRPHHFDLLFSSMCYAFVWPGRFTSGREMPGATSYHTAPAGRPTTNTCLGATLIISYIVVGLIGCIFGALSDQAQVAPRGEGEEYVHVPAEAPRARIASVRHASTQTRPVIDDVDIFAAGWCDGWYRGFGHGWKAKHLQQKVRCVFACLIATCLLRTCDLAGHPIKMDWHTVEGSMLLACICANALHSEFRNCKRRMTQRQLRFA